DPDASESRRHRSCSTDADCYSKAQPPICVRPQSDATAGLSFERSCNFAQLARRASASLRRTAQRPPGRAGDGIGRDRVCTRGKTSDQTILARQAMAPSPVAVLESRNAAAPRKDELLDSDATTEMMVKIAKDYQNRTFENIKASLNAALDPAKDLIETRVGG